MSIVMRAQATVLPPEVGIAAKMEQLGLSSGIPLLSDDERAALALHLDRRDLPAPLDWCKGRAATDRILYELAARPQLIALLRPLLGEDIVLWGATVVQRRAGTMHPWHSDMESADPKRRMVSVWLGLRGTDENTGLIFVAGSHRFGRSVQEVLADQREARETIGDQRMIEIARQFDANAQLLRANARDGEAVLFDGRMWHAGRNDNMQKNRIAVLLQYASAETPVLMPAGNGYDWPFRFTESPRVPAILVSGTGRGSPHRLVPPPPCLSRGTSMITTLARSIALPLAEDPTARWRAYHQFRGPTRTLENMSCHLSVLSPGHSPHPPHIHEDEELLVVIGGEVEIELAEDPSGTGSRRHRMRPGLLSYYPSTQHHTIHNPGTSPATYLMFKWRAARAELGEPLRASIFAYDPLAPAGPKPMMQTLLFQQATHCLGKLHAHLTVLQPGAGYAPHADAYDVAIVLLSGEVETIGQKVNPLGLVFYSAGELHGMRNVGSTPAVYLVFEFHSPAAVLLKEQQKAEARRQKDMQRAARRAERRALEARRQRRKLEKQQRRRGIRGLVRRIVKAVRRLRR